MIDTGIGSPVGPGIADAGEGSPASVVPGDAGEGSPTPWGLVASLPIRLRRAFQSNADFETFGFDPVYGMDGGDLVEAHASWPTAGPMRVQVVDHNGVLHPGPETGCCDATPAPDPSGRLNLPMFKRPLGAAEDAVYPVGAQTIIRFALPPLRLGTYGLRVTWDGGVTNNVNMLRVVRPWVSPSTIALLRAPCFGTNMGRR